MNRLIRKSIESSKSAYQWAKDHNVSRSSVTKFLMASSHYVPPRLAYVLGYRVVQAYPDYEAIPYGPCALCGGHAVGCYDSGDGSEPQFLCDAHAIEWKRIHSMVVSNEPLREGETE